MLLICTSAPASARSWRRQVFKKLGFSMLVPRGAQIEHKSWPGGWVGVRATHKRVTLYGVVLPNRKKPAALIRALGERITAIEHRHWTVKKTYKGRSGWFWYSIARGATGDRVALAVYGLGRGATYLMLLVSSRADARRFRAAHARWTRKIKLAPRDPPR